MATVAATTRTTTTSHVMVAMTIKQMPMVSRSMTPATTLPRSLAKKPKEETIAPISPAEVAAEAAMEAAATTTAEASRARARKVAAAEAAIIATTSIMSSSSRERQLPKITRPRKKKIHLRSSTTKMKSR